MIRRIRAYAGIWALIAVIAAATVFVLSAAPRAVNGLEDTALRRMLANASHTTRDLTFRQDTPPLSQAGRLGATGGGFRDGLAALLDPVLRDAVSAGWGAITTARALIDGAGISTEPDGFKPRISLAHQPNLDPELTVVAGRKPANRPPEPGDIDPEPGELEVMAAIGIAESLALRLGQEYQVRAESGVQVTVRLVGLFEAVDPGAAAWESVPEALEPGLEPVAEYVRRTGSLLIDSAAAQALRGEAVLWESITTARFRFDERQFHSGQIAAIVDAVRRVRALPLLAAQSVSLVTLIDNLVADFERERAAVRALLAVVVAGILATAAGLLFLAARLAADRRRAELRLLRARGASLSRLAAAVGTEAAVIVLPAVAAGWLVHRLVPGRGVAPWSALVLATVVAIAAAPLAAAFTQRERPRYGQRRDLARARPGPGRLTIEVTVAVLAALGIVLVHRRGLALHGTDPYLSTVPVLVGVAAGLLALRVYPWPVRALARLARRRRGPTAFLGLARAGRRSTAFALPLVVLVLAVALGSFAGAVRSGIDEAGAIAVATDVGGDFRVAGSSFPPASVAAVAATTGVEAVAEARRLSSRTLVIDGDEQLEQGVLVLAIDPDAYRRVLEPHGLADHVPAALRDAGVSGPVAALALPALAERMAGVDVTLAGRPVRVVGTPARLPGLDRGGPEVLLVPAAAAPAGAPVSMLLVRGSRADRDTLARAATPGDGSAVEIVSLADARRTLATTEFNDGVTLAFAVGLFGAVAAGLLAVGLALVIEARARGEVLSLLRTMGLSVRQARAILVVEVMPMMATAVLVGAAVGVTLPLLLAPALGLSAFTAGVPLRLQVDGLTAGLLAGLFAVLLSGAVLTEAAANRRLGLGQVLRVGAE